MNANLGRQLTLLGFCALIFYGIMLACGQLTVAEMPQFVITAVIFLSSGRLFKRSALARQEEEEVVPGKKPVEPDWAWLTAFLNWTAALLVIGIMAVLLMKPTDLSLQQALNFSSAPRNYFANAVP